MSVVRLSVSLLQLGVILNAVTASPNLTDSRGRVGQNASVEGASVEGTIFERGLLPGTFQSATGTDVHISVLNPSTGITTENSLLASNKTETRSNKDSSYTPSKWKPSLRGDPGNSTHIKQFYLDINDCSRTAFKPVFKGREGMIRGFLNKDTFNEDTLNGSIFTCLFKVTVPKGLYVKAYSRIFRHLEEDFCNSTTSMATNPETRVYNVPGRLIGYWRCPEYKVSPLILSPGNELYFRVDHPTGPPDDFWVFFTSTTTMLRFTLNAVYQTETSGYITQRGYEEGLPFPQNVNMTYTLHLPKEHVVMVSLQTLFLGQNDNCLGLFSLDGQSKRTMQWEVCDVPIGEAQVYETSLVVQLRTSTNVRAKGFKMLFSFHPASRIPVKMASGLFDCSQHFSAFRHHLDCNVRRDCEGGEDETDRCPYHSPQCPGAVHFEGKCVSFEGFKPETFGPWNWVKARKGCKKLGGDLASLRTAQEFNLAKYLIRANKKGNCGYVGLRTANFSTSNMYRNTLRWTDDTTFYVPGVFVRSNIQLYSLHEPQCMYIENDTTTVYSSTHCLFTACYSPGFFCERHIEPKNTLPKRFIEFPTLSKTSPHLFNFRLVPCPGGHVTYDFLSCDFDSQCKAATRYSSYCVTMTEGKSNVKGTAESKDIIVEMFACYSGGGTVPYTLVCDFRHDCEDGSDEVYCHHRNYTSMFRCNSGQHVQKKKVCDHIDDCLDKSDQSDCENGQIAFLMSRQTTNPPVIINYSGQGIFTVVSMEKDTASCPVTHFRCPGQSVFCMPVFLRCNGVKDCPRGEDELNCADFTCRGLFRCRGSSVCLHPSHLCDGVPQCPQREDEQYCNLTCPSVCQCQGLAFVCPLPFPADSFPDLRYLDGSGSGIAPSALSATFYMIFLRLSDCGLDTWPEVTFQNLQRLDLSDNRIHILHLRTIVLLGNLRFLSLKRNPLTNLITDDPTPKQKRLMAIDLSHTRLVEFNSKDLSKFPLLQAINLSFSAVTSISKEGFFWLPRLKQIDLTECDVKDFPEDLFHSLHDLSFIYASNYKLCCKATLPEKFNDNFCFAPKDEISSCEDLLRSAFYRVFLWIISFLSMFGNAGCLVLRLVFQRRSITRSGYNMFVTCLSLSDFLMGVYLAVVGVADQQYRGRYLWYEKTWKSSLACQVAGFLSLLSNEVSAFMICLITLDRFIVLRFPFSRVRFKGRSAVVASGLAWLGGVLMAAVPLMPSLSHWRFYSQTGICIPLPVTRNSFLGRDYSFGVMIVFNFVLFVAIACGQAVIYWSIRANSMASQDNNNTSRDLTVARRLITVVVSDFVCWFPIGVLGLLAFNGMPVPGEVNVAMAIFVLPLNSALNPFLYTFNIVMEKRRRVRENRLRKFLLSRAAMQHSEVHTY